MDLTRILFVSDVHGSDPVWSKFIRGAEYYKASVLVLGGDITGKSVVDVTDNRDGTYSTEFQGQIRSMNSKEELSAFEKIVRRTGSYLYVAPKSELEELALDKAKAGRVFDELILARVREWVEYADSHATSPVFVNTGNDDIQAVDDILAKSSRIVVPEEKVVMIDSKHEMISGGFSNPTPWRCPRDLSEDEIGRRLEKKVSMLKDVHSSIFNLHCPPVDSGLDTCPKLDASVYPPKPVLDGHGVVLFGAGSTAVRASIERNQPMLGLHGHIHESRRATRIGKTMCINPGSEYAEGILRAALVNIDERGYKSHQFVSG